MLQGLEVAETNATDALPQKAGILKVRSFPPRWRLYMLELAKRRTWPHFSR